MDILTINDFNRLLHQTEFHPQVAVIQPARMGNSSTLCFTGNFYAVYFKKTQCGDKRYGRRCEDFQYGTLVFAAPGDVVRVDKEDASEEEDVSGLLFLPELFSQKSLTLKKTDYTFFSYQDNESLHLSLYEKRIAQDCLKHIYSELQHGIDRFSLRVVTTGIELLLDYCLRFYERQFIIRTDINRRYLSILDTALNSYFSGDGRKSIKQGVNLAIQSLPFLSTAYLNDLVRNETGKTPAEYVRVKMMECIQSRPLQLLPPRAHGMCQRCP